MEKELLMIPGPVNVPDRVMKAMSKPIVSHRGPEFRELYRGILEKLKYAFQTENDVFPLTCSGTGGIECAVGNIVSPGDKVIAVSYGLFGERMREAIARLGGKTIDVWFEWGEVPSLEAIKEALDNNPDVKAITIVYNETSTGVIFRALPELGKIARKHDKVLVVDAVSA